MTKKNRNIWITAVVTLIIATTAIVLHHDMSSDDTYVVEVGDFENIIPCKGEMKSQHYEKINMPEVFMDERLGLYRLKINDLIEEGSMIKKGDYIATLDQERIQNRLNNYNDRLQNFQNHLNMSTIDSATKLTKYRNDINELEFNLQYKELEILQTKYESKSQQEKVKRAYNKAVRLLESTKRNYVRERMYCASRCAYDLRRVKEMEKYIAKAQHALEVSIIKAPIDGMLIYANVWGRKRKKGDYVSSWSPAIAVIPDLTKLVSESYVQEIYISKIHIGSEVRIKVDALPDKEFSGKIISISNIGKTVQGIEGKVFDISIKINEHNKEITHGMNTSNEIITCHSDSNLVIPLDYVFADDAGSFVLLKKDKGFEKRHVKIRNTNEKLAMITEGLKQGDVISTKLLE